MRLRYLRSAFRAAALSLLLAKAGLAAAPAGVSIDGAWARVSEVHAHVAYVYLTLSLKGGAPDKLVGAVTPVATRVRFLAPETVKGRQRLASTDAIELDPHAPTVLQPQGPHIVLKGVRHRLEPGDSFLIKLEFARSGTREVSVKVLKDPPAAGMPVLPKDLRFN